MAVANVLRPRIPEARLAALVLVLFVALALIALAELDPNGPKQGWGLYGFFLLQAAGWLGLRGRRRRFSRILGAVFVINLVFFLLLDRGLLGPQIDLIALNLVSVFFTAVAGGIGLVYAIAIEIGGLPGGPNQSIVRVLIVLVAVLAVVAIALAALNRPPPRSIF